MELDPQEAFAHFSSKVVDALSQQFPIKSKQRTMRLDSIEVTDKYHPDDIKAQYRARMDGGTWGESVMGQVSLIDNATGKVIDKRKVRLAEVPRMTKRYSYIVGGQEYQVDNQWQLKPGAYGRRTQKGEIEVQFNGQGPGSKTFDLKFHPDKKQFMIEWNKANIPLYPVLQTLGVQDHQLEKIWGKDILAANKNARGAAGAIQKLYKSDKGTTGTPEEVRDHLLKVLEASKMDPEVVKSTLGVAHGHVTPETLQAATKKMMDIHGGAPEDDRDSLNYKKLRSVGDFAYDKIRSMGYLSKLKVQRKMDTANSVRDAIKLDTFNDAINKTYKKNQAARIATQINPLEMVAAVHQTTVMGTGGIQSEHGIVDETKYINPSHFGFLDPISTPEGCFDNDTQVYTKAGWKFWRDVTKDDLFACLVDDRLEFNHPEALQRYHYTGVMYGVRAKHFEYLVTPNHRMLSRSYDKGSKYKVTSAEEIYNRSRHYRSTHGAYEGTDKRTTFKLPPVATDGAWVLDAPEIALLDWAEFLGWFLSEGSVCFAEDQSSYHVKLCQSDTVNPANCEQIERLLNRLPWRWHKTPRENGRNVYSISVKQLAEYMRQFGTSDKRYIPAEMFEVSIEARQMLLDTLLKGDGRKTAEHKNKKQDSLTYTTTSNQLALDVERLAISLGIATSPHRYEDNRKESYLAVNEVCLLRKPERVAVKDKHHVRTEYDGEVFCASVPGTFLYVRKPGKHPFWCGNSKSGVTLRLPMGVKRRGDDPVIPLYNTKTGKVEEVTPLKAINAHVALPDQYTWKDNKPVPIAKDIKYFGHGNELKIGGHHDVDYIMRYPGQAFNISSNLIPFLHSTQGNRAGMATRHMEQAISLVHREMPLVQSGTGFNNPNIHTFEQVVGKQIAHFAPVDGTVTAVTKDHIKVKDSAGKEHEVQLYNHYPLNDAKSTMHSTPVEGLAVGSKVTKDQLIADTNYSKNGRLALGTNLNVAFMPYHGINYEDGIVISESAAQKLSSQHLTKHKMEVDEGTITDPRKFHVRHPLSFKTTQLQKLGDDGVVRVGQKVNPGDPIMVATQPFQLKDRVGLTATRKNLAGAHVDKSVKWDSDHVGEVVAVHKIGDKVEVHVKTVEPMQVGDKISGRAGNKGICVSIIPDKDMPRTAAGKHAEVLLNPLTVPSRINPSQVFETVAGKIAQKTGKPFIVNSFKPHTDQVEELKTLAKQHGVSTTEELFDPTTGKSFGHVQTGPMHMIKLVHQIEKKSSVRSGMSLPGHAPEKYDLNLQPRGGSHTGGQSIGALGMYALLAHGAKATIRESQTYRSEGPDPQTNDTKKWKSQHNEVWNAIQRGTPIPPPAPTFAFQKFTDMLRAAAINVEKKGHEFVLSPMTDKHILSMSAGALPEASQRVTYKVDAKGEFVPKKGGLFDETLTGGNGGRKWTHIKLSEPVPNPIFEEAIRSLTNLTGKEFHAVVAGESSITSTGQYVADPHKGMVGGAAIAHLLKNIDVDKELAAAKKQLDTAHASKVDPHLKKVKYLETLKRLNLKPHEAYVLNNLPVIPPIMRPISALPNGGVAVADMNELYAKFALTNDQLGTEVVQKHIPLQELQNHRRNYYDGVKALMGVGIPYGDAKNKGLLHQIAGSSPKNGYYQDVLGNKRQDLSMRSTVVPEPALGLDQVGIPKQYAMDLFRPFVVRQLTLMGVPHALAAQEMMAKKDPIAMRALEKVMEDRPVLIKRDPVLHKYGIQGFKPVLVEGSAIKTHPMVCEGFNLDHDGDTMSVFVPISKEAVAEAHKMMPTNNLFAESSGKVMYTPKKEGGFGLYRLSLVDKDSKLKFGHPGEAVTAVMQKKLGINDLAHIDGKHTTVGRILMASALPEHMQHKVLTDHTPLNSKNIEKLFTEIADHSERSGDRTAFGRISNRLKDLGNGASTGLVPVLHLEGKDNLDPSKQKFLPIGALTLSLKDFTPDRANRDPVLHVAQKNVAAIMENKSYSAGEKERRVVAEWSKAEDQFQKAHVVDAKKDPTSLFHMHMSGQKPGMDQYKQLALAPMLVKDTSGRTVPIPLTKTFSEGLDMAGYWVGMYGARRGVVRKVQEVQEPGVITKMMQNTTMDTLITADDCGTKKGIAMAVTSPDIHDRHLSQDLTIGSTHYPAGTLLTPKVVGAIRAAKPDLQLQVRSPLKCEHDKGVCQKCYGTWHNGRPPEHGTNVGVIAAHSLGERVTQLMLRSFHCMHEHSMVLVKEAGVVKHTTLGVLHKRYAEAKPTDLFVWDRSGWTKVLAVSAHEQHPNTAMVMCRTRSGNFIISQDNHPHMLRKNAAVCESCGTYPKRCNKGKQYYCRKCHKSWQGEIPDAHSTQMVQPYFVGKSTHRATVLCDAPTTASALTPIADGWLAGMYCAEGCTQHRTCRSYDDAPVAIAITQNTGTDIYDKLVIHAKQLCAENGVNLEVKDRYVRWNSVSMGREYAQTFGRYARNKGLPEGWSGYRNDWLLSFVAGVMDGDGTFVSAKDSKWLVARIDTTSVLLAQQLHWILRSNNIPARVQVTTVRALTRNQGFAVTFVVTDLVRRLLSESLKIRSVRNVKPQALAEGFYDVVDYVKPIYFEEPPTVYDLTTETGTLFVNGFWTHNSGGVAGKANAADDFDVFKNLVTLPDKLENQATIAMKSGTIKKIEHDKLGTTVYVDDVPHFVGKDQLGNPLHEILPHQRAEAGWKHWEPAHVGMSVKAGQTLSDPNRTIVNPKHLYQATKSIEAVQNHLSNALHGIFGPEGVDRRHAETLVKSMTSATKIDNPGAHPELLRGEVHNTQWIRSQNQELNKQGKPLIKHSPILRGINTLPLYMREDWMAKMQHQHLRDTVMDAASRGLSSNIHGLHPIPGITYGAEFGLNKAHSNIPGYEKLKDVPITNY